MISHRQLFLNHLGQTSEAPLLLEVEKAEGSFLYLKNGKKLIDLIGGISVCNIGHSHPNVLEAIKKQSEKYLHVMVYGELVQSPQTGYATFLTSLLPPSLNSIYFTNSGTEAIEGAMKLCKRFTQRSQFISFKNAYHGSTQGALSLMGDEYFKTAFRPLIPDTLQLNFGDENELEKITQQTAAVFIEPVQAESGVTVPSTVYLKKLREHCTQTQTLLVFDESQTGFGRTGSFFGFEKSGVVPDILVLSKALGGGLPLGAFICNQKIMHCLTNNPVLGHITTFGGHPLSCAAGLAAASFLKSSNTVNDVEHKGMLFEKLLTEGGLINIHRSGLLMAIHFSSFEENKKIIDRCIDNGVFTDWFLFAPHALRISAPLTISEEEIKTACKIILESVKQ